MPVKGIADRISAEDRALYKERLATMRAKDRSWNQAKLADLLNVGRGTISEIFSGVTKQSPLKQRLEKILGIGRKTPTEKSLRDILLVAEQLDDARRERLYERGVTLLEEQKSS